MTIPDRKEASFMLRACVVVPPPHVLRTSVSETNQGVRKVLSGFYFLLACGGAGFLVGGVWGCCCFFGLGCEVGGRFGVLGFLWLGWVFFFFFFFFFFFSLFFFFFVFCFVFFFLFFFFFFFGFFFFFFFFFFVGCLPFSKLVHCILLAEAVFF